MFHHENYSVRHIHSLCHFLIPFLMIYFSNSHIRVETFPSTMWRHCSVRDFARPIHFSNSEIKRNRVKMVYCFIDISCDDRWCNSWCSLSYRNLIWGGLEIVKGKSWSLRYYIFNGVSVLKFYRQKQRLRKLRSIIW